MSASSAHQPFRLGSKIRINILGRRPANFTHFIPVLIVPSFNVFVVEPQFLTVELFNGSVFRDGLGAVEARFSH